MEIKAQSEKSTTPVATRVERPELARRQKLEKKLETFFFLLPFPHFFFNPFNYLHYTRRDSLGSIRAPTTSLPFLSKLIACNMGWVQWHG